MTGAAADPRLALELAHDHLRHACSLLLRPSAQALESCGRALDEAQARLRECLAAPLRPDDAALRAGALAFQRTAARARRLVEAGQEHHACWAERLSLLTGGYSREGGAAPGRAGGSLSVQA